MAFVVQNDSGSVTGANAYITLEEFQTYHEDRCNDISAFRNRTIRAGIIKATDYLDVRFRFVGEKQNGVGQTTSWPRLDAENFDFDVELGVPDAVKEATAEYALVALRAGVGLSLAPAPERDATGQAVTFKRDKVDVIEEERRFSEGGAFRMPKYPDADKKLTVTGLAIVGGESRRG